MHADWDCFDLALRGDQSAWRILVERHRDRIYRMALLVTGSPAAAADAAQGAFVRLLEKGAPHQRGSFKVYLATIAYRLALKERRRSNRLDSLEGHDGEQPTPGPLERVIRKERDLLIAGAIGALPPTHREVLVLRFHGEMSYEEIARVTGQPLGTVKSRIFHAVKKCRSMMRERGIAP